MKEKNVPGNLKCKNFNLKFNFSRNIQYFKDQIFSRHETCSDEFIRKILHLNLFKDGLKIKIVCTHWFKLISVNRIINIYNLQLQFSVFSDFQKILYEKDQIIENGH